MHRQEAMALGGPMALGHPGPAPHPVSMRFLEVLVGFASALPILRNQIIYTKSLP